MSFQCFVVIFVILGGASSVGSQFVAVKEIKQNFQTGVICNYESFQSISGRHMSKYLCVPEHACKKNTYRFPAMPYDGCNHYLKDPNGGQESYKCCHPSDILEASYKSAYGDIFMPGVRSYLSCRHYAHTLCDGDISLCYKDITNFGSKLYRGNHTTLNKYPYMALIGHQRPDPRYLITGATYIWYCHGSIISPKYVLTSASCNIDKHTLATHVKVGEDRYCERCTDRPEEQLIRIYRVTTHPDYYEGTFYYDIALMELYDEIKFNKFVRPACIYTNPFRLYTKAKIASYGDNLLGRSELLTPPWNSVPNFQPVPEGDIITFSVQATTTAVVTISSFARLDDTNIAYFDILIGSLNNSVTQFRLRNKVIVLTKTTPGILSGNHLRQFWIKHKNGIYSFGEEDHYDDPLMSYAIPVPFRVSHYGVSTPEESGGYWTLSSSIQGASAYEFEIDVIFRDQCIRHVWGTTNATQEYYSSLDQNRGLYDELMFCGWKSNSRDGPCFEDYGSAAVTEMLAPYCMWNIVGILASKPGGTYWCGEANPKIYARVTIYFINWMENILFGNNFNTSAIKDDRPVCLKRSGPKKPGQC